MFFVTGGGIAACQHIIMSCTRALKRVGGWIIEEALPARGSIVLVLGRGIIRISILLRCQEIKNTVFYEANFGNCICIIPSKNHGNFRTTDKGNFSVNSSVAQLRNVALSQ